MGGKRWLPGYTKHLDPVRPETVFQLHESGNSLQAALSWISSINICICKCTDKSSQDLTFLPLRGPNKILPKFTDDTQNLPPQMAEGCSIISTITVSTRKQILNQGTYRNNQRSSPFVISITSE